MQPTSKIKEMTGPQTCDLHYIKNVTYITDPFCIVLRLHLDTEGFNFCMQVISKPRNNRKCIPFWPNS